MKTNAKRAFLFYALVLALGVSCLGQGVPQTNVTSDNAKGLLSSQTFGGERENIDLSTGNLDLQLPLLSLPGRHGFNLDITLIYDSKPLGALSGTWDPNQGNSFYTFGPDFTSAVIDQAGSWRLNIPVLQTNTHTVLNPTGPTNHACYQNFIITTADGSSHTFPNTAGCGDGLKNPPFTVTPAPNTTPGRAYDLPDLELDTSSSADIVLRGKDGTAFHFFANLGLAPEDPEGQDGFPVYKMADKIVDTNGNTISIANSNGNLLITDTLGRVVTLTFAPATGILNSVSYIDSNGKQQMITLGYGSGQVNYTFTNPIPVNGPLSKSGTENHLTSITLPSGLAYKFEYNTSMGELSKASYPTGGYTRYEYGTFSHWWAASDIFNANASTAADYREITARHVCRDPQGVCTASTEDTTTYLPTVDGTLTNNQVMDVTDPLGNRSSHKFTTLTRPRVQGFGLPFFARELFRYSYQGNSTLLVTTQTEYNNLQSGGILNATSMPVRVTTTLNDSNMVKKTEYDYDADVFDNVIAVREYAFGSGAPGALLRRTQTAWMKTNSVNNVSYIGSAINILNRKQSESVYDSLNDTCQGQSRPCAQTAYEYDNYTTWLVPSGAVQHAAAFNSSAGYTARGNLTAVQAFRNTDNSMLTTRSQYDDAGNIVSSTDPAGNTTSFSYVDAWGENTCAPSGGNAAAYITNTTNAKQQSVSSTFNSCSGTRASATDANGKITTFSYDLMDRLVQTTLPADSSGNHPKTTLAYNEATLPVSVTTTKTITASANLVTTSTLDGLGRTIKSEMNSDPLGLIVDTTYDALGRKATESNPHRSASGPTDGITQTQYDALGRVVQVSKTDGSTNTVSYSGNCVTAIDEAGKPRKSCSDALGRMIEVDEPNAASTGTSATATVSIGGTLLTVNQVVDSGTVSLTAGGFTATACYGSSTNSSCINQPLNNTAAQVASALASALNVFGSPISATSSGATLNLVWNTPGPFFPGVSALVTAHDQPNIFVNPSFTSTATMFDHGTGPSLSANPYVTLYQYDVLGNLLCVEQHGAVSGTGCSAPSSSDSTSPWRVRRFTYDSLSRLLTSTNPEAGLITYFYDANGNLLQKVSPTPNQTGAAQHTVSYCYDALNRVTGKAFSWQNCQNGLLPQGTAVVSYSYDQGTNGTGRMTAFTDQAGSGTYTYDALGRVSNEQRIIAGVTKSMSYTYNLDGSVATATYPSGAIITYSLDAVGRALSAIDNGNHINYVTGATYGPSGLIGFVSGQSTGFGGVTNTTVYDVRLQPCRMTASSTGAVPTDCDNSFGNLLDLRYRYDLWIGDNGNVTQVVNYRDQTRNQKFTYDGLNRLTSAQNLGTDCTTVVLGGKSKFWGNSYSYDAWGNLLGKTPTKCSAENLSVTAGGNNQLQGGNTYDAAGNLTHDAAANLSYVYDSENRLMGAGVFTYTYDAESNRVEKSNGTTGTIYWYMSMGIVAESDLTGSLKTEYIFFGGQRVARKDYPGNTVSYYFSDHLKTASIVTDANGNIQDESDYYPWGGELQFVNNLDNHYKFTGKERDGESGLDYYGARYYSNTIGRFVSADWSAGPVPIPYASLTNPQTLNLYALAHDNPSSYADLDGHLEPGQLGSSEGSTIVPRMRGGAGNAYGCVLDGCNSHTIIWQLTLDGVGTNTFFDNEAQGRAAIGAYQQAHQQNGQQNRTDQTTHYANVSYWWTGAGGFGHIGIGIDTDHTRGFSTADPSTPWYKRLFGAPEARTEDDIAQHTDANGHVAPHSNIRIPITAEQAKAMQAAMDSRRDNPGHYNLFFRNCTGFVESVLHAGGVSGVPHAEVFGPVVLGGILAVEHPQ